MHVYSQGLELGYLGTAANLETTQKRAAGS